MIMSASLLVGVLSVGEISVGEMTVGTFFVGFFVLLKKDCREEEMNLRPKSVTVFQKYFTTSFL